MLGMMMPGPAELAILALIVCVLFSGRVAALFGGLARGLRECREEISEEPDNDDQ